MQARPLTSRVSLSSTVHVEILLLIPILLLDPGKEKTRNPSESERAVCAGQAVRVALHSCREVCKAPLHHGQWGLLLAILVTGLIPLHFLEAREKLLQWVRRERALEPGGLLKV